MLQTASSRRGSERGAGGRAATRALRDGPIGAASASCPGSAARSSTNCATRGSCHARRKLAQTSVSVCRAQIAADERQRVDELDEPVGQHDQQRGRMLQAVAQLLEQPRLVEVDAHAAAVLLASSPAARRRTRRSRVVRQLEVAPGLDGVAGVHRAPGVEAVGAELIGEIDGRADLVRVERRRREVDLERHLRRAQVAQALDRLVEARRARASARTSARRRRRGSPAPP